MGDPLSGMLGVQHCTFHMERECGSSCTKKTGQVCNVDNFRGVSLSSTVCNVMCMILNKRLLGVAEKEGLIADEQGGF